MKKLWFFSNLRPSLFWLASRLANHCIYPVEPAGRRPKRRFEPAGQQSEAKHSPKRLSDCWVVVNERIFIPYLRLWETRLSISFLHSSTKASKKISAAFLLSLRAFLLLVKSILWAAGQFFFSRQCLLFYHWHCILTDCLRVEKLAGDVDKIAEADRLRRGIGRNNSIAWWALSASLVLHLANLLPVKSYVSHLHMKHHCHLLIC